MKRNLYIKAAALLCAVLMAGQPALAAQTYITVEENDNTANGDGMSSDGSQSGDNPDDGGAGGDMPETGGVLKIDDAHVYDGMNCAYKDGYEPSISGNTASIVVPLLAGEDKEVKTVTAALNLGGTQESPFVYKNYQKTFEKTTVLAAGSSEPAEVFLVRFDIELLSDRYNGVYPVEIQVSSGSGMTASFQNFTVYVRIADGKNREEETVPAPEPEEKPTSQPILMISKSEIKPGTVTAGEDFEVTAVIKNTSKIKDVQNMSVTAVWSSPDMTLLEDSNMFYVDYLGAGKTMEMTFKCTSGAKTVDGKYELRLDMSYDTLKAETLTSSGVIQVNVAQPMKVELEIGKLPDSINAGDSISLPLQVLNLGRGKVYNVRCNISVPGLTCDTSAFMGNMEGGSAAAGNLKVFAGMKETEDENSKYGPTSGVISLIYEDENGTEHTKDYDVFTTVNPLEIGSVSQKTETEEESMATQWWIAAVAAAVVILTGVGIFTAVYLKKRKMR